LREWRGERAGFASGERTWGSGLNNELNLRAGVREGDKYIKTTDLCSEKIGGRGGKNGKEGRVYGERNEGERVFSLQGPPSPTEKGDPFGDRDHGNGRVFEKKKKRKTEEEFQRIVVPRQGKSG